MARVNRRRDEHGAEAMSHCYVCGVDNDSSDPCRAVDGEIAECPRPSPAFRKFREDVQRECRQVLRAKDLNRVEQWDET